MAQLDSIVNYLNSLLPPEKYKDHSQNGLQVECPGDLNIDKIACAVDSGLSIIEKAVENRAKLLIVHHGLFWGESACITGILGRKIKTLLDNGCSLYASHLPLDGNAEVGNAVEVARFLNCDRVELGFSLPGCAPIGAIGDFSKALPLSEIVERGSRMPAAVTPLVLPFGKTEIKRIGIVTGSGSSMLEESARLGLDLLVSGEPKHAAYHEAKELRMNVAFFGHYATETFGPLALLKRLTQQFDCAGTFIEEPTGI